jgi:hypothetical protein
MKRIILLSLISFSTFTLAFGFETAVVIKVNGPYGIISKGANQGIQEGQMYNVKRETAGGLIDIGQVKVIRTTANRAAVEILPRKEKTAIEKGDKLYEDNQSQPEAVQTAPKVDRRSAVSASKLPEMESRKPDTRKNNIEPITEPVHTSSDLPIVESKPRANFSSNYDLRRPWLTFSAGAIFPTGQLSSSYSPSLKLGGSYMVSAARDINLGVEINKTFFGGNPVGGSTLGASTISSSSILEAFLVFQKYFGNNFFVETGGGIFRPQIQTISVDDVETSYSSSHFGFFGGTGFFVPTSEYAGFALRGRVHNYFDSTSRQYFDLAGGFRFKIQ